MTKPKVAAPTFWPLPALAQDWRMHESAVLVVLHDHKTDLETRLYDGVELRGISPEAKLAIDNAGETPERAAERSDKLKSALFLLGMGLHLWTGEDEAILGSHYAARDFLANDARNALGIVPTGTPKQQTIYRTRETDAEVIREANEIFRNSGIYKLRAVRDQEAAIAAARARALDAAGEPTTKAKAA